MAGWRATRDARMHGTHRRPRPAAPNSPYNTRSQVVKSCSRRQLKTFCRANIQCGRDLAPVKNYFPASPCPEASESRISPCTTLKIVLSLTTTPSSTRCRRPFDDVVPALAQRIRWTTTRLLARRSISGPGHSRWARHDPEQAVVANRVRFLPHEAAGAPHPTAFRVRGVPQSAPADGKHGLPVLA